ncbi:catalase, partial [Streptosporangium sandarakinum]
MELGGAEVAAGDTKVWPENEFPALPVGRMVLNRGVENNFAEN